MKEQADPAGTAINSFNSNNNNNVIANHNQQQQQQQQQQYSHHLHHHSKDVNHSSDTEDCDLELGSGRLVIDLEAETTTTTTATTTTNDDIKATTQKSAEIQSFNSSNINSNSSGVLSSKKANINNNSNNNNNLMKMNHSFSDINNSNSNSSVSGRGRVSYSISSMPNSSHGTTTTNNNNTNNNNGGSYSSTPQVSYSTVSMNQESSNNPTHQNKCIKMKIKRNTVAQGPHAPLSATSQLSATLHQQHSQNSPPPSSSSSASLTQQQHAAASVASCSASSSTAGNNGYQTKTTVVENSVFTYKIQHSSVNNCPTSVNSVTCKNVPLGSLPSLSSSVVAEGVRGLNHHSQHSTQGGTSYLSEGCQTTPYNSSGGMPTRSSKQPNSKRSKQSHGQHNSAIYRDSTNSANSSASSSSNNNNNNNKGNNPTSQQQQQQQQLSQQHEHAPSNFPGNNNNNSKQPFLNSASYSGVAHHPFGYDSSVCPKYAPRGSIKGASGLVNGQREKMTTPSDPYDFNCTTEDNSGGVLLKKLKIEKCERACSPMANEKRDVEVEACHIGIITDPDCLGPCEPGTSVTLEGIVWNETENGLLVVNVTWRGKTYVGTLMDATRHHWAPPRFTGESPTSDLDGRAQKGRGKRGRNNPVAPPPPVRPDNGSDRKLRSNRNNGNNSKQLQTAPSPVRSNCATGHDFGSKKNRNDQSNDAMSYNNNICRKTSTRSESRMSYTENTHDEGIGNNYSNSASVLIECPEENCNKKYRNSVGLKYHQTRCHQNKTTAHAATVNSARDSPVAEATGKTLITKEVAIKNDMQERNSISSEDGNVSPSSSSSSHSNGQKHRSSKINSVLRHNDSSKQSHVSLESAKKSTTDEPPDTGVHPPGPSNASFPLVSPATTSSPTVAPSPPSSCINCIPADKIPLTGSTEMSATAPNASPPDAKSVSEPEVSPDAGIKGLLVNNSSSSNNHNNNNNNNTNNSNNSNNNISSGNGIGVNCGGNELKQHSISTMIHQTTETCPTEKSIKRKKRERHPPVERNEVNVTTTDGCCAPSAKNPKLEIEAKESLAVQDKMNIETLGSFTNSSGAILSASVPVTSMTAVSSSLTGNLYAGTIDRPIYISAPSDECLTPFSSSSSALASTSSVIRSTSGLPTTSIYEVIRDSPPETNVTVSATSENSMMYSTHVSNSIPPETPTPKQASDKRHSPLTTTSGDFPSHGSSAISMDLSSSPEFTHSKRLRLTPADDKNTPQQQHKNSPSEMNAIPQDAPSPAYSDISDANENAPMLEKEANQTSMSTEDEVSVMRCLSSEGPSTPLGGPKPMQDSFVCSPFYGLMPQLTPVVSSPVVVNREFSSKFSLVGGSSSNQYGSEDVAPIEKPSPPASESSQKVENKFVEQTSSSSLSSSKKHDFSQSSQRTSSSQMMSDTLRKTPSTSIMSSDITPNQQVHLLTVPPMSTLGFPQTLFSGPYNFGDREVRAHWERFLEMHQKQYDVELHKELEAKYRAEGSSLKPISIDDRYRHAGMLPAPPSLISDYSKFKTKEDYPVLNPAVWDGPKNQSRDISELRGAPSSEHHSKGMSSDKYDRKYLPPPHMLEQPFQHQSKAGAGEGGKPSAVVAPQTREKIGNGQLPKGSYDTNSRESRSLLQQHPKYSSPANNSSSTSNYSGNFSAKNSREGRQQSKEDNSSNLHKKDENNMKSSSSLNANPKAKLKSVSGDVGSSQQPTGLQLPPSPSPMPAPYPPPSFYPPFLTPGTPYMPSPFDPAFLSTMNPMAALLQQPPYGIHPSQILHPAAAAPGSLNINTSDPKSQAPGHHRTCLDYDSGAAHHKIHELKEVAKGEASSGNPGSSLENRPLSSGGMQHSSVIQSGNSSSVSRESVKEKDLPSEPALQRHLHTHHHMHVIGPYTYMNSESAMLASQPNNSSGVSPQLPHRPSYLGK